ncbi:hypothetical protein R5W23_003639 [Gemmata sp. JC673]|uniref:DUF3160 domain-containing protein n=1 Tax=Gemmata algarum TaxID=2975278 RepID=A0ABU5F3N6_9BACT|nr:hypothetical protein [Gemmata algarum]MDY3562191.1 hypothetical protein [Gemmata algarum]
MRRFLLSLAVLATVGATPTFAGYIIIRVLLEGGGATPGGESAPGGPGGVGPGSVAPPGSFGGPGPRGGSPGMSPPGAMGSFGPGAPGSVGTPSAAAADPTRSIVVVVPLESDLKRGRLLQNSPIHPQLNPEFRKIELQHYGQKLAAYLFVDSSTVQLYEELLTRPGPKQTRHTEVLDRYAAWRQNRTDGRVLYDAIVMALQAGMVAEAVTYADELVAAAQNAKVTIPERDVKPFVAAWSAVRKAVADSPGAPSDAALWQERLDFRNGNVTTLGHYSVIAADNNSADVVRRATQLNDNFKAFFLWHATRGEALPVPTKPLVAVLAPGPEGVRSLNRALDGLPISDAFYAPDHGLLVLSPERMDDVGQTFLRQNQQLFGRGFSRQQLLSGKHPKIDFTGQNGTKPDDVAHASTLAAVERLAIDDAEIAAVSREGSRQLLYATGVLPQHVTLPVWLTNGAVNFFTRPRGPAYVTVGDDDAPYMHVALATGYGGPNYVLQRHFRDLVSKKELPQDADRLLENVLGDVYFNGIKNGDDPDPAPPKKVVKKANPNPAQPMLPGQPGQLGRPGMEGDGGRGPGLPGTPGTSGAVLSAEEDPALLLRRKQQRLALKANATSWALYYYLAKARPADLKRYVAELNKLPRDLPIDGRTALGVFVRVFGLATTEGAAADPVAVKKFADDWLTYINSVGLVGVDVPLAIPAPKAPVNNPMGGMPPGSFGPGGGEGR